MEVRLLGAADAGAVASLYARAADYVLLETGAPPGPETVAEFFAGAPSGQEPAQSLRFGLFRDGRLDGIAELAFDFPEPGDAYLGLMLLATEARGGGLGRAFLRHVGGVAQARGCPGLYLAVLDENVAGRRFWDRAGFRVVRSFPAVQIGAKWHIRHRMYRPPGEPL